MTPRREASDWLMLAALTAMWGSSFMFTKLAVGGLAVEHIVLARLVLAALLLLAVMVAMRRRLPRGRRVWVFFVLIALVGNLLPFSLITWGQRAIDSGLAGILMAVMPLATLGLAHLFVPGERLTRARVWGFMLGFGGVVALIGPEALLAIGGERGPLLPMLAILAGAICYGISAILARLRPATDALTTAAAVTSLAAVMALPTALATESVLMPERLTLSVIGSVLFLGVFSTAAAMLVYFRLIQSAGPGFTSQLNYLIPLWAVAIGILFLGETQTVSHLVGLLLILCGILVARRSGRPAARGTRPDPG